MENALKANNEKHQEQDSVGFAGGLQTEIPNQEFGDQRIQRPVLHPLLQEVQPQREEVQRVGAEDVLIVSLERPLFSTPRPRIQWTGELNTRFCRAVDDLGGIFSATPTTTLRKMNVRGVTVDHIRSRLQNVRRSMDPYGINVRRGIRNNANGRSPQPSGQGSSTNACVNGQGSVTFEAGNEESGTSKMAETPSQDEASTPSS